MNSPEEVAQEYEERIKWFQHVLEEKAAEIFMLKRIVSEQEVIIEELKRDNTEYNNNSGTESL